MITLPYSLVIEATEEADFFGFYSPDLEGFTGIGHSVADCFYKARSGMADRSSDTAPPPEASRDSAMRSSCRVSTPKVKG